MMLRLHTRALMLSLLLLLAPGVRAETPALGAIEAEWTRLVGTYVVDDRWIDYARWHADAADRSALRTVIEGLAAADPFTLDHDDAIATWINLYNAVTVDLVLEHHPVRSIKDIGPGLFGSPWKIERVTVAGRRLTLDEIEHEILRKQFHEPRIHFALNCASVGCPPLASTAFSGAALDRQLDAVTRRTLRDREWVDLRDCADEEAKGRLRVTKLFDWFEDDFGGEQGVRAFIARYREDDADLLRNRRCSLDYMDYDWSLNAPPPVDGSR